MLHDSTISMITVMMGMVIKESARVVLVTSSLGHTVHATRNVVSTTTATNTKPPTRTFARLNLELAATHNPQRWIQSKFMLQRKYATRVVVRFLAPISSSPLLLGAPASRWWRTGGTLVVVKVMGVVSMGVGMASAQRGRGSVRPPRGGDSGGVVPPGVTRVHLALALTTLSLQQVILVLKYGDNILQFAFLQCVICNVFTFIHSSEGKVAFLT